MKKIHKYAIFLLFLVSHIAPNHAARPEYLTSAGNAWLETFNQFGRANDIANQLRTMQSSDLPAFLDMIDAIAYNDSAMNLYHINGHLNRAMGFLRFPNMGRRPAGKTLAVDAVGFADFDDYETNDSNSDFKSNTFGANVRATGYIGNGMALGVGYTTGHADTKHTPIDTDVESNSITIFTEYMNQYGLFLNLGIGGGTTRWEIDKTIAGIPDDDIYNTDFYAGQITGGIQMARGVFAITPHVGMRYTRISADGHSDAAAQSFGAWWYNLLTANAGIAMQFAFPAGGAIIVPHVQIGGTYDAISNGTDDIQVTLAGGKKYAIPIDTPHPTAFIGTLGMDINANKFQFWVQYVLDARSDYISHSGILGAKFIF